MRGLVTLGLGMALVGCGATSGGAGAPTGAGSGGASGLAAAGGPGGGGAVSSSAGAAGNAPSGGIEPCGGELVGDWTAFNEHFITPPNPDVDACWNLRGGYFDGSYTVASSYPKPEHLTSYLVFAPDGTYTLAQVRSGPVEASFAADCLTAQGSPSCADLQAGLLTQGLNEGTYHEVACTAQANAGCSCVIQVDEVGGPTGSWVVDATGKAVTLTKPMGSLEPRQLTVGYCADATGLRFDGAISPYWFGVAGATFTHPHCQDGVQSPGETGVDCGFICKKACPMP